ncbi:hypothetical protein M413DRAFT_442457 [Hebeloma cylindrosporum]|uniref:C2H2-type domain-containing protein n=1 Tax=Hebeloma cylindrosporum TaxID=76867 RepID=A0A0C3CK40_HEBCY|nr:hypothetical protein M413DRAFT_442457 [Hebeloma cylindrosporum h7]
MAAACSSRIPRKYPAPNPPCVDCTTGAELECEEPNCVPTSELTAQCTDQCVVIACCDPDHAESICDGGNPHTHCDLGCEDGIDCGDCLGFDNFLQCCDDPYSVDVPRSASSNSQSALDAAFEAFLCGCGHTDPSKHQITGDPSGHISEKCSNSSLEKPLHPSLEHPFVMNSFPEQLPPPKPVSALPFKCMWGNCHASFSSANELVGHVNLDHLVNSTPNLDTENFPGIFHRHPNQQDPQSPLSCLWGDCNSSYLSTNNDIEKLTTHLMNDHLGLQVLFPQTNHHPLPDFTKDEGTTQATPSTLDQDLPLTNAPQMSMHTDYVEPPSPMIASGHSCTGTHACQWKDCQLTFDSCDGLTAHINGVHIGSGKAHYDCFWDNCSRNGQQGFQSKQKICRHVQSHTGHRPFQCDVCQQYFSEAATLQQHKRRHTQEKPYVCDYPGCGKSFAITGALTIHKRTHNGDKPFKCTYCDRGFAESSNLSKHLRTHTGARPYTCPEPGCQKAFARPDQLNRHKSVHRKKLRGIGGMALEGEKS